MKTRTFRGSTWLFGVAGTAILLAFQNFPSTTQAQQATNVPAAAPAAGLPGDGGTNDIPAANFVKPASIQSVLPTDVSPGVAEVAKLIQAHLTDDVILAYIRNSNIPYRPTADEIVYLNDLGVSPAVMTELIERGKEVWEPDAAAQASAAPAPSPDPTPAVSLVNPPDPTYSVSTDQSAPPPPAPAPAPVVVAAAAPPVEPVTVAYLQDSLSPYGNWVYDPEYGYCWQPTVVMTNPDWQPYCDRGHWVYTDCGWYWQSDYSWGWAPFHYGRWWRHARYGWVWMPDTVWGPSWVCWRNHDVYCGWAPLPPRARFEVGVGLTFNHARVAVDFDFGLHADCFTFVAFDHFRDPHPEHFRAPAREVAVIYRNSHMANNFTVVNRTTIVNEGVGRERVVAMTHQPLRPVTIQHVSATGGERKMERVDSATHTLAVYHPPVKSAANRTAAGAANAAAKPAFTVNKAPARPATTAKAAMNETARSSQAPATAARNGSVVVHQPAAAGNNGQPARPANAAPTANSQTANRATTTAPAQPAAPAAQIRATITQPAAPQQTTRATTVAPAAPAASTAPATTARPAATENAGKTPSYSQPTRQAPASTRSSTGNSGNTVKYGNGNRNSN